jgi:hypothetical protein
MFEDIQLRSLHRRRLPIGACIPRSIRHVSWIFSSYSDSTLNCVRPEIARWGPRISDLHCAIFRSNFKLICLSSIGCKNNLLRLDPKSPLQIPPSRPEKRGVGHRHERWGGVRWTRQRQAREVFAGRLSVSEQPRADERRLNASAMASVGRHSAGWSFWRGKLRTAKPCGSGARCWRQAGEGLQSSTGQCEPSIRRRWRQEEFVSRESSA